MMNLETLIKLTNQKSERETESPAEISHFSSTYISNPNEMSANEIKTNIRRIICFGLRIKKVHAQIGTKSIYPNGKFELNNLNLQASPLADNKNRSLQTGLQPTHTQLSSRES